VSRGKDIEGVSCTEEQVVIPTYPVQDPDPNPMFFETRVYQGSSGKVYPNPFTDRVSLEKKDVAYRAIFLENEFVQLMILPEIGGRIHTGLDKTNHFDFFYRQNVIKPALVGLLGPWISGGVEFNWPQHHRPSTYMPVHASIEEEADGSRTVWLSEHDPMLRMKGMVGIRLSPGKAIVEARVRLYNRTPLPQTFLWWANVAVRVHDKYQAFFPPDVTFVADHAKRAISSFPIARNHYYGVDYRPGTDITWYKNIPVPTSYMVTESKYDFFGGYDHARQAGFVHSSNHFIAPGKKLWTWGNVEFGHAWDRNLTDEDGPYVELMAGAYTDNQPDFSWLQPYETKTFSQYWYPIQQIGPAKNANQEAAVNVELASGQICVGVCVTSKRTVRILLTCRDESLIDNVIELAPGQPFTNKLPAHLGKADELRLVVYDAEGRELIAYEPEAVNDCELPGPAKEPDAPSEVSSIEELFLIGLHLEQYRHATRNPELYYLEGLRRDPDDARLNNAMGLLELRRGRLPEAEAYFETAVSRLTSRNPNPFDGEPFYNLGLARMYQRNLDPAYEAFHKAVWSYAWKSAGYYGLACVSTGRGDLQLALQQVQESLLTNGENLKALALRASILRRIGDISGAQQAVLAASAIDSLDFRGMAERYLLTRDAQDLSTFCAALQNDVQTLLDVTFDLAWSGLPDDALGLLNACVHKEQLNHPMLWYALSWLGSHLNRQDQAADYVQRAECAAPLYCFPSRIEEMIVLEEILERNPLSAKANYYLGNLYYDKRRYQDAIDCWRNSAKLDATFSIPLRNLGIAEFNVLHNAETAAQLYEDAFAANPRDARLLYELDQLKKRTGLGSPEQRFQLLDRNRELVTRRDDLTVESITLLNQLGQWEAALDELAARRFSPWEGGEGLVSAQYVIALRSLGQEELVAGHPERALRRFETARKYPENLGEGKHMLTLERDLDYYSGLAAQQLGQSEVATRFWRAASAPLSSTGFHSYFQAQAFRALGNDNAAQAVFSDLRQFAQEQMRTKPTIDYFATSLPNMLLFNDDLERRNRLDAQLLMALLLHGLGSTAESLDILKGIASEDPNHQLASEMFRWIRRESKTVSPDLEVSR
jgi:tetratricopeptide (TPR) repeat protein